MIRMSGIGAGDKQEPMFYDKNGPVQTKSKAKVADAKKISAAEARAAAKARKVSSKGT